MQEKLKQNEINGDIKKKINKLADEGILDVLKKRDYYQSWAVEAALDEAIKRELIHSEEDLLSPEFRVEPLKPSLFPKIDRESNRARIRRSLGRSFLITGVLPLILGFTQINEGQKAEGTALLVFGISWIFVSSWIIRQMNRLALFVLSGLTLVSVFYVQNLFQEFRRLVFMDIFITAAMYLLILYGLFFLFRIGKNR